MAIIVRVSRFDPSRDKFSYFDTYKVPVPLEAEWTAMDVLDYIHRHLDSSLRYYRHSTCNRGVCVRCMAKINGKSALLCKHIVAAQSHMEIAPLEGRTVVKDLVWR